VPLRVFMVRRWGQAAECIGSAGAAAVAAS
jgi:hypothetical protein